MKINKTRTFDQGPITPLQIQNKNKRAPTIYTCKRSPVRGQESRLVRARLQFERPNSVRSRDGHIQYVPGLSLQEEKKIIFDFTQKLQRNNIFCFI
jgi:hypothetical protein